MVARLYAYIEALVKDYNNFAELVDLAIDEFINAINIRLKSQDDKIQDIYDYMVEHLDEAIYNLVEQGRITLTLDYDPIEEALSFTATPIDGGI